MRNTGGNVEHTLRGLSQKKAARGSQSLLEGQGGLDWSFPCTSGLQDGQGRAFSLRQSGTSLGDLGRAYRQDQGSPAPLLSHRLVSSCVSVSVARLTALLGKHSLSAPAAEPLLAHHCLGLCTCRHFLIMRHMPGPTAWLSPAVSQESLQVRAEA